MLQLGDALQNNREESDAIRRFRSDELRIRLIISLAIERAP